MALDNKRRHTATIERDSQAFELWLSGASFRSIGKALDIGHTTANNSVKRALDRLMADNVATMTEAQDKELARLDRLISFVWGLAARGDLAAVAEARKLIMARCRVLGLLKPDFNFTKVDVHVSTDDAKEELSVILGVSPDEVVDVLAAKRREARQTRRMLPEASTDTG